MKGQLEITRADLMKDLQYHQEVNKKSIEAHTQEKKKLLDEMNSAVKIEIDRLKILQKTELTSLINRTLNSDFWEWNQGNYG